MSDIFLSYKREDRRHAKSLAEALQEAGWSVWWDPRLRSGERFDDAIERELKSATCVIVVWSNRSVRSQYVRDEAAYALRLNKLIPVTIDDVELPFRYQRLQTESLAGWKGSQAFPAFKKILDDIASVIGRRPVKSRKRGFQKDAAIASSTKRSAVNRRSVNSRKRGSEEGPAIASATKRSAVRRRPAESRKRRSVKVEGIASSTKGLAVARRAVESERPEVMAPPTNAWAQRNERILFYALRELMRKGLPYGFLIASVEEVYVQFALQGDPQWLYVEAVSNAFLPEKLRFTKASADLLAKVGFEEPLDAEGNFYRHYKIDHDDALLQVARLALTILRDVYRVGEQSSLKIKLDL